MLNWESRWRKFQRLFWLSLPAIARRPSVSPRYLQRLLEQSGASFRT
jgi:hypothetical protein